MPKIEGGNKNLGVKCPECRKQKRLGLCLSQGPSIVKGKDIWQCQTCKTHFIGRRLEP